MQYYITKCISPQLIKFGDISNKSHIPFGFCIPMIVDGTNSYLSASDVKDRTVLKLFDDSFVYLPKPINNWSNLRLSEEELVEKLYGKSKTNFITSDRSSTRFTAALPYFSMQLYKSDSYMYIDGIGLCLLVKKEYAEYIYNCVLEDKVINIPREAFSFTLSSTFISDYYPTSLRLAIDKLNIDFAKNGFEKMLNIGTFRNVERILGRPYNNSSTITHEFTNSKLSGSLDIAEKFRAKRSSDILSELPSFIKETTDLPF